MIFQVELKVQVGLDREEIGGNSQSKGLGVGRESQGELSAGLEAILIHSFAFLMLSLKCIERAYGDLLSVGTRSYLCILHCPVDVC